MRAIIKPDWEDQSSALDAEPGNWLLNTLRIDGYPMHLQAIRVSMSDVGGISVQTAHDSALDNELSDVFSLYDGLYETTTIPGYEGDFILYAHPFGD